MGNFDNAIDKLISNKVLDHLTLRWAFYFSVLSVIFFVVACLLTGVSTLHTFKEYAMEQEKEKQKNDFIKFHNNLGTHLLYAEKIDTATKEFNQVLKIEPTNIEATTRLLECDIFNEVYSYNSGTGYNDLTDVETQLYAILNSNSSDPVPYLILGDIAQTMDQDRALKFYNKSISIDSNVSAAYSHKGYIFYKKNDTGQAIEMYMDAYNISNWDETVSLNLAEIYYEKKDYNNSRDWYEYVTVLDPNYLLPYYYVSNSYRFTGDFNSAISYQNILIQKLDFDSITNRSKNQDSWVIYTGPGKQVDISDLSQRKYHAYYNSALTYYIMGNENGATEYINKAKNLNLDENLKSEVKLIIDYDIKNLQDAQPNLKNVTEDFKNKFE